MTHDNNALAQELEAACQLDAQTATDAEWTRLLAAALNAIPALRQPAPAPGEVGELVRLLRSARPTRGIEQDRAFRNRAADMLERLATVVSYEIGSDDTQADLPIVGETHQPEDHVERVAEAIDQWIGDISASREMARAAIAAMKGGYDD